MDCRSRKAEITCRDCGREIGEDGVVFIEEDWGICGDCSAIINWEIEQEKINSATERVRKEPD